ncbi:MAG TPA: GNAT family protein [Anaerolineales bacterium]
MPEELWKTPITLEGKVVRLEPMNVKHIPGLAVAGKDESIWKYMVYGNLTNLDRMTGWVREMLSLQDSGTDLPYAVVLKESGNVIGATRYLEMRLRHRSLEIGGTWYAPEYQRTAVNSECKYLMLKYAFEEMNCIRVQFKADERNERSLLAIERLGAVREGVLRNHYILLDGTIRDSVFFSILDREWPDIKIRLEERLKR